MSNTATPAPRGLDGVVAAQTRLSHVDGLGGVLIILLGARALLGPRPRRLGWRLWTIAAMLALSLFTAFELAPRIDQIRRDTSGSISSRPDTDPLKQEFGRLHGLSNIFMLVTLVGGVGLLWIETTDTH